MNLRALRERGLRITTDGDRLLIEPRSALTDELREAIRAEKPSILRELVAEHVLAERVLEGRRARVERQLLARPELRRSFDVADTPLTASPGEPVSVVLAVRHGEHILSGELHSPRERWDMELFLRTLDPGSERPS